MRQKVKEPDFFNMCRVSAGAKQHNRESLQPPMRGGLCCFGRLIGQESCVIVVVVVRLH